MRAGGRPRPKRQNFEPPALLLAVLLGGASPTTALADPGETGVTPVELVLNGQNQDRPTLAVRRGTTLLVLRDDLLAIGIFIPDTAATVSIDGQAFVSIADVPQLAARLGDDGATLFLQAGPDAFGPPQRALRAEPASPSLSPIAPLAFLGYDLSLATDGGGARLGGLFDAGLSGAWGVAGTTALLPPAGHQLVRLDSAFQRDLPAQRLRLVLGDTISRGGDFSSPLRFGGIRIGTDFSLDPEAVTTPLATIAGSALLPSTVELLAASGRVTREVRPGRFLVEGPVTVNGAGELVMRIEDATGGVRQISQRFYSSARLLRPGLDDLSFEAGALRRDYGLRSNTYGDVFAAVGWRRGLTPYLTAGARVEATPSRAVGGLSVNAVIASLGEVALAGAMSNDGDGTGSLLRAQVQRIGRDASFSASYTVESAGFAPVGEERPATDRRGRQELGITASLALPVGEISLGLVDARLRDDTGYRLGTLGYSASLGPLSLYASLRRSRIGGRRDDGFFVSLSRTLGSRSSAALTAERGLVTASFQQAAPPGGGIGVGLSASRGSAGARWNAYALATSGIGDLELTAAGYDGRLATRTSLRGALVMVDDRLVPTGRLDDGLALVEVAGEGDVAITQEGRPVARRAGRGKAVILTGLVPYAANRIGIRTEDVALAVDLDEAEKLAVPGFRQAAIVRFGRARAGTSVTIALIDERGQPLAPGLEVSLGGTRSGVTGYDGQVFIDEYRAGTAIEVRRASGNCLATLPAADTQGEPLRCTAIREARAR
ncbi:fimbrial biogenesis outer membrane usher protein [Sphingomonas rosea]|uniref:Fimbrial biogenesis outer membrane usher protein n=1 Tax=Sphingomonas rosea TaxID=335605 RepID=A0ABP7TKJ2_9SPHN